MSDDRVTALNPTVRRALGRPAEVPPGIAGRGNEASGGAQETPAEEACPQCHGVGLVPVAGESPARLKACSRCRNEELRLLVAQTPAGTWIAVRDLPGLWGSGGCAVEALLDLERRTPESSSIFGSRYLRAAPAGEQDGLEVSKRRGWVA